VPSIPGISDLLANYLRQFSLWTRRGFAAKADSGVAQPAILLQEAGVTGIPRVYSLTIKVTSGTPAIVLTEVPLGGGKP
jgi:hypothetical protein